jgi:hypothetical protein
MYYESFSLSPDGVRRIREKLRSGQLQVAGDQWPIFLYANYMYDPDDPWNGLLRSGLLVCVRDTHTALRKQVDQFSGL